MFIKKLETRFTIIAVYVDDLNLIGTLEELSQIIEYLKEFEIKDLDETKLYFSLEFEHKANRILIHQSAYIESILKYFNIDKAQLLSTLMAVWYFEPKKDLFRPKEPDEEILGHCRHRILSGLESCFESGIHFSFNLKVFISVKFKFSSSGSNPVQSNCPGLGLINDIMLYYIMCYVILFCSL